jgi:hypothetical protein
MAQVLKADSLQRLLNCNMIHSTKLLSGKHLTTVNLGVHVVLPKFINYFLHWPWKHLSLFIFSLNGKVLKNKLTHNCGKKARKVSSTFSAFMMNSLLRDLLLQRWKCILCNQYNFIKIIIRKNELSPDNMPQHFSMSSI